VALLLSVLTIMAASFFSCGARLVARPARAELE
jgi:hypothetical protein